MIDKKIADMIDSSINELRKDVLSVGLEGDLTPIEKLIRGAFMAMEIKSPHWLDVKFWPIVTVNFSLGKINEFADHNFRDWCVHVFPQVSIGRYTVDFLAMVVLGNIASEERGRHYLAIECDGHEFHEKTKEQAAHDKSRDRFLTGNHIPVMRFAGSEIWKDPKGCAGEVIEYFDQIVCPDRAVA